MYACMPPVGDFLYSRNRLGAGGSDPCSVDSNYSPIPRDYVDRSLLLKKFKNCRDLLCSETPRWDLQGFDYHDNPQRQKTITNAKGCKQQKVRENSFYSLFSSIVAMRYPWKYEPHLIPSAPGELFCCNLLKYYAVVSLPRRWYNTLQETQLAGYLSKTVRTIMAKNQVFSISSGSYS